MVEREEVGLLRDVEIVFSTCILIKALAGGLHCFAPLVRLGIPVGNSLKNHAPRAHRALARTVPDRLVRSSRRSSLGPRSSQRLDAGVRTGANSHVTELFAFFHDSRRFNEHVDDGHGQRGAELARQLKGRYFDATDDEMDLLNFACTHHSDGLSQGNLTVMACWDSDRLDLGRVGITPDPRYLCTAVAKNPEVIARAHGRAKAWRRIHARTQGDDRVWRID